MRAIGSENVTAVLLPYGYLNPQGVENAKKVVQIAGLKLRNVVISEVTAAAEKIINSEPEMDKLRKGNIIVRLRMIYLFDLAKKNKALVLGTENKTEYLLGYFTRFGDEASDIEPLLHLYKTEVKQLAAYLGVPREIILQKPTAGMWQYQTDEGEFGFSYEEADKILHLYIDQKKTKEEIVASGFNKATVEKVLGRMSDNSFKHRLPYIFSKNNI